MPDFLTTAERSALMAKIKGKNTKLEQAGWLLLKATGIRFRKHPKGVYGRPDAGHKGKKIAVFFDSEFWHGKDWKSGKRTFDTNKEFWIAKIERNIARDKKVNRQLKKDGWTVIRIWSKDLQVRKIEKTAHILIKKLNKTLPH